MIRKLFYFLLMCAIMGAIWFSFAIGTGIYSVYSIPPSRENPDGATMIVSRQEGEPMFNSPQYVPPAKKPPSERPGLGFASVHKEKKPLDQRTIVRLPYIAWAYKKSLEPQDHSR